MPELYAASCPAWCDHDHAALLAVEPGWGLLAEPVIFHEHTVATSPDGCLAVVLVADQCHPEADWPTLGERVELSCEPAGAVDADTLDAYARTLRRAARRLRHLEGPRP